MLKVQLLYPALALSSKLLTKYCFVALHARTHRAHLLSSWLTLPIYNSRRRQGRTTPVTKEGGCLRRSRVCSGCRMWKLADNEEPVATGPQNKRLINNATFRRIDSSTCDARFPLEFIVQRLTLTEICKNKSHTPFSHTTCRFSSCYPSAKPSTSRGAEEASPLTCPDNARFDTVMPSKVPRGGTYDPIAGGWGVEEPSQTAISARPVCKEH